MLNFKGILVKSWSAGELLQSSRQQLAQQFLSNQTQSNKNCVTIGHECDSLCNNTN